MKAKHFGFPASSFTADGEPSCGGGDPEVHTDFKGWLLEVLKDLKQEAQEVQGITKLWEARLSEQRKAGAKPNSRTITMSP